MKCSTGIIRFIGCIFNRNWTKNTKFKSKVVGTLFCFAKKYGPKLTTKPELFAFIKEVVDRILIANVVELVNDHVQ